MLILFLLTSTIKLCSLRSFALFGLIRSLQTSLSSLSIRMCYHLNLFYNLSIINVEFVSEDLRILLPDQDLSNNAL